MNVLTTRTLCKTSDFNRGYRPNKITSSAIAATYPPTEAGPERQAALAALTSS